MDNNGISPQLRSGAVATQQPAPHADTSTERLEAYVAEYQALRAEIEWLIKGGEQYQNFAIALLGASATLLPWVLTNDPNFFVPSLLTLPFLFSLLGFLYLRQHEEVFVVASYLKDYIRPRIRGLTNDPEMWAWEEYKAGKSLRAFGTGPLGWFSAAKIVFMLRSGLFLIPSLACLAIVTSTGIDLNLKGVIASLPDKQSLFILAYASWCAVDAILVLAFAVYLWAHSDLARRILHEK